MTVAFGCGVATLTWLRFGMYGFRKENYKQLFNSLKVRHTSKAEPNVIANSSILPSSNVLRLRCAMNNVSMSTSKMQLVIKESNSYIIIRY
jgi:hypothetical protein